MIFKGANKKNKKVIEGLLYQNMLTSQECKGVWQELEAFLLCMHTQ